MYVNLFHHFSFAALVVIHGRSITLLISCFRSEGNRTMEHLFRVEDAELRARVALQGLEQWPLASCLELLRFCLSDRNTECSLKEELELKKQELQIYQRVTTGFHKNLPSHLCNFEN